MDMGAWIVVGWFVFVFALLPSISVVPKLFGMVSEDRARARAKRRADGLPDHERCGCSTCAAWRRKEFGA